MEKIIFKLILDGKKKLRLDGTSISLQDNKLYHTPKLAVEVEKFKALYGVLTLTNHPM